MHLGRATLLLGALTLGSCRDHYYTGRAYFANTTREPVNVRVQNLLADVDCAKVEGRSAELLAHRELFGEAAMYALPAGETFPLDIEENWDRPTPCAAMIQIVGMPDHVVYFRPSLELIDTETRMADGASPQFRAQSVRLEGHGDLKALGLGSALEVTALLPEAALPELPTQPPTLLGWSGATGTGAIASLTLLQRETLPDGCLSLTWGTDVEPSSSLYLCAPDWSFPYQVGSELDVSLNDVAAAPMVGGNKTEPARGRHLLVRASGVGPQLEMWINVTKEQVQRVTAVNLLSSQGFRTGCGAYAEPISVDVLGVGSKVLSGEEVATAAGLSRAFVGRADNVLVAPQDCGADYSALGSRFDLLILDTPEEKGATP